MTKYDTKLLMKALRGEPTDKVPFWEVWFAMERLAQHLIGKPAIEHEDQVAFAKTMGWEYLRAFVPCRHPGVAQEVASDGTSHYVHQGKIPLDELYNRPDPDLTGPGEEFRQLVHAAHNEGMAVIAYIPWCFHAANTALGLEQLSYLLYDEPDYIDALFEWVEEGTRKTLNEVLIPSGVDVVLFDGDCAYKTGLMINPKTFRELVFDRTMKTMAPLKAAGIPCAFHSDGKADDLLPILIDLGFSAFHGVEAQANDLADIKDRFGKDITLIGNMDVDFLTHATVDEVKRATERMLSIGMKDGRYIAACNTSPLDYIPYENYLAMVDVIKNF